MILCRIFFYGTKFGTVFAELPAFIRNIIHIYKNITINGGAFLGRSVFSMFCLPDFFIAAKIRHECVLELPEIAGFSKIRQGCVQRTGMTTGSRETLAAEIREETETREPRDPGSDENP